MNQSDQASGEAIQETADSLEEGDRVRFDDRTYPLTVTGRHENPITKAYRRRQGSRDYHDVVELKGNGTIYHLLWHHGTGWEPILRKRSQWTEETEDGKTTFNYSASGDRVYSIEILDDGDATSVGHVGPIVFSNPKARNQLVEHGEVVTFRAGERTTGETWWRESRTGKKKGDCTVEELDECTPYDEALRPHWSKSGFDSVMDWQEAIEEYHGGLPEGHLYRVTEGHETN